MQYRDRQNEILVAIIVTIAMAFALIFSIVLSLDDEKPITEPTEALELIPLTVTETALPPTETDLPPTKTNLPPTETALPPTETALPPTETALPPTETNLPPTETNLPPTETALPPTETALPPTETDLPPTETALPPTETNLPPTKTALPPTETNLPPTETDLPPTETDLPPTETDLPPTETALPPTETALPPTETALPPTETALPPTETALPPTETDLPPTETDQPTFTPSATFTAACQVRRDWDTFRVDLGDTLFSIARRYEIGVLELAIANCLDNPRLIYAGALIYVPPPNDNPDVARQRCETLEAAITSPTTGDHLSGKIGVEGVAYGENFIRYTLAWRGEESAYEVFAQGTEAVLSIGDLGEWDAAGLPEGLYWIRLQVYVSNGRVRGECAIRVRLVQQP